MAIYKINNDVYDIPEEVVSDFERDNPDAVISYRVGKDEYEIPLHEKGGFLKHFPDAVSLIEEPVDTSMDFVTPKPRVDVTGPVSAQPEYKNPLTNTPEYNLESIRQSGAIEMVKGERDDKGRLRDAVAEKRASIVPELGQAIEDVEESKRKYRKEHPVLSALSGFRGSMAPSVEGIHINDPKFRNLSAASQLLNESERLLARHNGGSGVIEGTKSVIEGAKEAASDLNTYSMGLTEMLDNSNVLSAITKFEKGEELSPDEQHLLDAVAINMSAQAVAGDPDLGHLAGSAFVESIPFMVEMMMNPISGAGEGLGKAMTKYALKRFGKKAGSKALEKGAKIAGRVAGDAMAATGMAATSGIAGVAADATARRTGTPVYTDDFGEVTFGDVARDEKGEVILDGNGKPVPVGSVGKEGEGKALYKAFTSRSIENISEMFGEYFGMAGKTLMNTKLGKKVSSSALMRAMNEFTTADWTKQFNQILKDGKYNGFIGETAEEYVGGLLNAAFVGDQSFEDLASTDNLVQTVAAVGLMSGIFGSVNLAGIRLTRYKARKDLEKSEKEAYKLLGEDFDVLRDNISSLDPDAQKDAIRNVLASPDLDRDQKEAVFNYFYKQSYYNGLKFGENKRIEEAVQAETEAVRAESNPGTGTYIEASKIDPLSGERIPGTIVQGTMEDDKDRVTWKETEGKPEMILKPEIDPATVRAEPIQDVIDASVEAVRESEQAKIDQDSRYSPDIPEPQLESTFTVNGKKYIFTQPTPEGWFLAQEVKEDGSLGAVTDEFDKTAYFDAKQAEIDAAEAIQDQGIQGPASNADITFADKPSQIMIENAVTSPSEESNMSQNPAGAEESAADVPDQDTSTVIPADESGNLLYHQAPVEATLSDILDGSLDSDEIDAFVGENKKAAGTLLKKVSEKPPKMSTNKTKYLAQKKAWSDRVAEAEQQVAYWNEVESILKESRMKPGDKAAEEIKSMGEPLTGEELAAVMLANGSIKLTKESYKKETGAGEEEAKKMFGLFATPRNGGVSIERAGELVILADLENGTNHFDQEDPNAGRNAIIEVLSSARTRGDLIDYVKNNREAMAERERQAEYNAYAEWCEEVFHMSPEEYDAYEEDLRKQAEAVTDEAIEYVSGEIADEIQLIREEQSEIGAILAQNKKSDEKIERNDEGGTGGLREGSGQLLPEEQSIQAGGTGRTEEGYSAADLSLNSEDGIAQESASREIDENGKPFVLSSDGTTTFGVIPHETGLTPAPIKLSEGFQNEENKGYGLRHIESNHGEQILGAGFPSIENFVETVAKGFTVIKKGNQRGGSDTYLLEVKDKHNNTLFVELSKDGSYWNVNSAGIFNERYSKKKDIVWTLPAVSSSTNADATGVNHGTTKGETVTSGNSPQTISSGDKYNDISPQKQADDKKIFVSPERADDESLLDYAERVTEAHKLFEEKPQTDLSLKENTNAGSEMLQKAPYTSIKPIGIGILGSIFTQFKGNAKAAIEFLLHRKEGDAVAALFHKDVGDIDLYWGNEKAGLMKIARKHPEVLDNLQAILENMKVMKSSDNRIVLESDTHKAIVSKKLGDVETPNWLLSAYEKKEKNVSASSSDIETEPAGKENGTAAFLNVSFENKDSDISSENQTEEEKVFVSPERKEGENLLDYAERISEAKNQYEKEDRQGKVSVGQNRLVTDERYAELKRRMLEKLGGQMNIGVDPETLAIGMEMAVYHIEKGARKFSAYAKAMISDLGDSIRPYLKAFYNGARELPEMEVLSRDMDNYEDVRRFDVTNFDKPSTDILAMAETISKEQEIANQVKEVKRKKNPSGKKGKDKSLSLQETDLFNQNIKEHEEVQRRNGRETKEVRTGSHEGSVGRGGPGNKSENLSVGRQTREEVDGRDAGREAGGVHGGNGSDQDGSGGIHGLSSLAPSVKKELNQNNYHFDDNHLDIPAGDVSKLKANLSAIRTLHEVENSGKPATEKQKEILSRYVGWGGLSNALNESKYSLRSHPWNADTNWNAKYLPFYEQLKETLTEEEFKSAIQSTTTSHYTPEPIIRSLWKIAERIGFRGGRVSEPAMGVGHIIGFMPKDISSRSWISGFEIDSLSGRISKVLYPDAHVRVEGYETEFTPRSKDLVITNVPFGKEVPYDKALDRTLRKKMGGAYNLHNYFITKGLLELKEGGLGVFVTSSATMDGTDSRFREFVAGNGIDLVGAIRLPNNAFLKNAGTSVTADVLVFRRRGAGEASNGINFVSTTPIGEGSYEEQGELRKKPLMVNEYFAGHPEMMLGDMMTAHDAGSGGLYSGASQTLKARPDLDLNQALSEAIDRLPKDISGRDSNVSGDMTERTELSNGTLTVKDNKVYVSTAGVLEPISVKPTFMYQGKERSTAEAVKDYNVIKDTLKRLILAEQSKDADPEPLRKQLNEEYDRFVKNYGTLNRNKALNDVFAEDNEHSLPLSLEKIEKIPSPSGKSILYQVSKGKGILNKRVSFPVVEPSKAANLQDAINISRSYRGTIDVPYIAQLVNMSEEEAMEDMLRSGVAYRDPLTGNLVDKSVYLSGNVKEKLEEARAAADSNPEYEKNVADLASVQPDTIRFGDISYRLGTTWIPAEYLNKFAEDVVGIANANVQYISVVDEFVLGRSAYVGDFSKSGTYKTDRVGVIDLFAAALNQRKPKVYDEVNNYNPSTGTSSKTRVVNEVETQAAAEKIMELSDKFVEYIDGLTSAHKELERIYNDRYNNFRLREYELPSFEHYPHSNEEITLREHQTKAVQRCLSESTLLAHQVGTGKTFTMVTTAMEMRRLGIAKKPMIVVQNATLEDFVKDFYKLYPGAHVLAPGKDERGAENRTRLFNLIATGDFDAIVIPQSFMQFIPDDEGRKKELIQKRIETYERVIEATEDESLKRRLQKDVDNLRDEFEGREKVKKSSVKEKAKAASRIKTKVERNLDRRTDEVMTFEQMGIDALFIDEAHNFKKIGFVSKMSNVKGIDTGSSQRANSLLLKSTWIREKNNGRNVILATGTPITNTMAEVWTMMNFVAPDILEAYDIESFDEFATTFGTVEPSLEFTATGNFKIADRFKSYVNVPELVKAFRSHADVVLTKDVTEFEKDKSIPKLRGEQITNVVIDKNEDLQDVMQVLIKELEAYSNMSGQEKKRMSALPLVVFTKAKQAAIDLRLINPTYPDNPNSKTNQVVSNVIKLYKESEAEKGAQLVFCDSYQSPGEAPKMDLFGFDPDVPRFNLYEDIKQKLIEGGIPEKEIAIVNNYDGERRKGLFEKVRNGDVRVLLGSTEKMGVGVNVQDRLYGLHHIDAPLRPMDFEQRNGRILRQGNNYALWGKPVNIVTYGVQGTLDATAYDRLQIKQNFINQMMKGDVDGRIMEDQDDEDPSGMTFNQMAATLSGDKTAQLLFVAENKLKKLRNLKRGDANSKSGMAETVEYARGRILVLESKKKTYERIHEIIAEHFPRGVVSIKVEGKNIREKFASSLDPIIDSYEEAYSLNRGIPPLKMMLNAGRAEVVIHFDEGRMVYELYAGKEHVVEGRQFNGGRGLMSSIEHQLKAVENNLISVDNEIVSNQRKIEGLTKAINTSWGREDELKKAEQEVADLKKQLEEKAKANDEKKSRAEAESTVPEGEVRYRSADEKSHSDLDKANRRFNLELQRQIDGALPEGFIYQLGRPSEALRSAGIPNLPIELSSDRLAQKASKEYESGHPFSLESIKNLPEALNNPIAIFDARKKNGAKVVLTTLTENGNNFIAAIQVRRSDESRKIDIEVNSVRSLYPKDRKNGILEWINLGLMKWVDKKKASNFFSTQWPNYIASGKDTESISSATKIVENFQNPTPKHGEIVSEIENLSSKLHTPVTIVNDVNEITDANEKTQLRKRSSKGWYDPQTKEIVIVLPNNRDVADAQRTFLHEAVAHHGLRKLFGDDFDTFLNNVYANANEGIRREILRRTQGNPLKLHEATEEYLADLAERGFDNKEERSLWSRIKDAFIEMLRKVGVDLGFKLSDTDLRYILWRSYRNLEEGNLLDLAEDVSMRNKWGIGDYGIRYKREATDMEDDGTIEEYEKRLRRTSFMAREAYQDSTLALRELQDILAKHSGKKIETWENADIAENQRSSKNTVEKESYRDNYFTPLLQQIANLIKRGETYQEIVNYMIAKHGLERNDVFARRDADAWLKSKMGELDKKKEKEKINESDYEKQAAELKEKSDRIYDKNKEKDYSGLKGLMKDVAGEIGDYNEFANTLVYDFESRNDSSALWEKANEATNRILKKSFESGLMSKGTYEHIKGMFKYYIPLRGWDETTAADVYSYINSERSSVNSVPHKARGRVSLADDPIATIANMAESAIMQGNRNLVKQNFLNMIVNHPASVATVKEMWYVFDVENNCWKPSFPEIPSTAAPDEIALIIEEHDKRMKNLEKQNLARRNIKELDVKYQILPNEVSEHIVSVKRNGKEYVIFINGNPRAAQAVNGLTNPDAEGNIILSGISKLNRQLAANFTTRNPGFVGANLSRDLIFAMSVVSVKENSAYSARFRSNIGKSMAVVYRGIVKGKLDMSNEADRYFKEFLKNGGETGYTALTNVDQYKKKIQKDLEGLSGNYTYTVGVKRTKNEEGEKVWTKKTVNSKTDYFKVIRYMADRFSDLNRWAEDISRFTTYMTSRQEGRGIVESVNDAKEVTVNFNRKGAGYKTMIKNKPWYSAANVLGASAGIFRNLFLFFNAGVQSLENFGKLAIRNKKGFGELVGGFTVAGFLIPFLNQWLSSLLGDDKDYYNDLSDWTRKNNMCIYAGGGRFVTIPLPIELRAFWGLGDLCYQNTVGKTGMTGEEIAYDAINQITELLPLNPLGNNGDYISTLMPDVMKPFWQLNQNEDFTGKPIYKENDFNQDSPEWSKAYKGTASWLVNLSEWTNELGGGDKYRTSDVSLLNWNPAKVEHLFEAYFGGLGKTFNQLGKTLWYGAESVLTGKKSDNLVARNVPVLNRFLKTVDEKSSFSKVNKQYYRYVKEYEDVDRVLKGYAKEVSSGNLEYLDKLTSLQKSDDYKKLQIFQQYKSHIEYLEKQRNKIPEKNKHEYDKIQNQIIKAKSEMVEWLGR